MCLHGLDQSGHEHAVAKAAGDSGNSESKQPRKTSSMSAGISPASNLASQTAFLAIAAVTRSHSLSVSVATVMLTWYGSGRDPWTTALTWPGPRWRLTT